MSSSLRGSERQTYGRRREVEVLVDLRVAGADNETSRRAAAKRAGVPRTTLEHWARRSEQTAAPPEVISFFESPPGLLVLGQIVQAAQFVISLCCGVGVRPVCAFLELSGLSPFVAAGYGTQRTAIVAMEEAILAFGESEKQRLKGKMTPKEISVCQDETFHPEACLVAIEPVSNYILLEQYSEKVDARAWNRKMDEALAGLPVEVVQSTSDEGQALARHVRESLGAHHSPDLFHIRQELSRGTSLALAGQVRCAEDRVDRAAQRTVAVKEERDNYEASRRGPGRPRDYDERVRKAVEGEESAKQERDAARLREERARDARRGISASYHPFDLHTGAERSPERLDEELRVHFATLDDVAEDAGLAERCRRRIDKARRLIPKMIATFAFVHSMIRARIEALELTGDLEDVLLHGLVPGLYIEEAARRASPADIRSDLRASARELLAPLSVPGSPLEALPEEERRTVEKVAADCAALFQRSSSCVEGRNGVLSLRHHSLHRLTPRKLAALTVVHNFFIERADGTTAAERFFGQRPRQLFSFLLGTLPPPKRSAASRMAPT